MCLGPAPLISEMANGCSPGDNKSASLFHRPVALDLNMFTNIDIGGGLGGWKGIVGHV